MDNRTRALMMGAAGSDERLYVEDVFSTYLYTGNGSTQTITNGINLSSKGGMVWTKSRSNASGHALYDTLRGTSALLASETTNGNYLVTDGITAFSANGYTLGSDASIARLNYSPRTYASWTFREQAKFFDVVTYTGNGANNRQISHSLGSTPGCIIVKRTDAISNWMVYHRNLTTNYLLTLNSTAAQADYTGLSIHDPTSTNFQVDNYSFLNASGGTYVAYLFAHDAGGFGASGNDSVIKCGSYTGNGSTTGPVIDLGWEPQWLMIKRTDAAYDWWFSDNMRGMVVGGDDRPFLANTADAEQSFDWMSPTATGFQLTTSNINFNASGGTYIYIAIRRGPMKTPTDATKVFSAILSSGSVGTTATTGFPVDTQIMSQQGASGKLVHDRLRGVSSNSTESGLFLNTTNTNTENSTPYTLGWFNEGFKIASYWAGISSVYWNFRRAPGFFDVVAHKGVGSGVAIPHSLGVAPQMIIAKNRGRDGYSFVVWTAFTGTGGAYLDSTGTFGAVGMSPTVTSSSITYDSFGYEFNNGATDNYIAYLFASCPGVSKVGSYTGTGTAQQINCGFTSGARFVLIKRTNSTGDWYVWDTARGIVSGNDPYLLLNSTAAEVTNTDYIDPLNSGFEISSTAPAAINANGGTYIFLAIA